MLFSTFSVAALTVLSTLVAATEEPNHRHVLQKRAVPKLPGASPNNLKKGNIGIGFIPGWGEPKGPNDLTSINKVLPKPMTYVGTYYQLSKSDPNLSGLDGHLNELLAQKGDKAVFVIAMGAPDGIASVNAQVAKNIATKMASINALGVTVYLRYLWEMNGDWYAWGNQPKPFLKSWQLVTNAVRANKGASKTYMLWSPNSRFAAMNASRGGWSPYWPGAKYVDVIGLSFYSYGGYERKNIAPAKNMLSSMLKDFSNNFAAKYNKPIMLSETAAGFAINLDDHKPNDGGDSELKIKSNWFSQLISPANQKAFPYYKAFVWFEIIKDESATGDSPVRQEDFRCLLGSSAVRKNVLKQIGTGA